MGCGSSTRRGGGRKLRARPRNFVFLGFRREESGDVPGILPGCPGPLAVFKKFGQKNFVRIFRSLLGSGGAAEAPGFTSGTEFPTQYRLPFGTLSKIQQCAH